MICLVSYFSHPEIIRAQKEQTLHLKGQVSLLEKQKKELTDAGNMLSEKCGDLDNICDGLSIVYLLLVRLRPLF